MKSYFVAAALAASLALSGCEFIQNAIDNGGGTAELGTTFATLKYIEQAGDQDKQIARAVRVRNVAQDVKEVAHGDSVTVAALQAYVEGKLPADLSPADRFLANSLVEALAAELQKRIGDGVLDPDKLLVVDAVLQWVIDATEYYAPAPV